MKISFVVAIYNVEKYIECCLESLVNQNYDDYEIILVNDGSTDDSYSICNRYAEEHKNIILINQNNQGANIARNNGLNMASGDWIVFVDGDDYVAHELCVELSQYLDDQYDVVMFSNYSVFTHGTEKKHVHRIKTWEITSKEDIDELKCSTLNRIGPYKYNIKTVDPVTIWNKAYNHSFLKRFQIQFIPHFPKLQDISFNLTVYEQARKICFVDYPWYYYREATDNSVTRRYQEDIDQKFQIINEWFFDYMKNHQEERLIEAYYERIVTHLRTCVVLKYCNPCYQKRYSVRKKEFLQLLEQDIYREAVENCDYSRFPWKERILSLSIMRRHFLACEMMNLMRRFLNK